MAEEGGIVLDPQEVAIKYDSELEQTFDDPTYARLQDVYPEPPSPSHGGKVMGSQISAKATEGGVAGREGDEWSRTNSKMESNSDYVNYIEVGIDLDSSDDDEPVTGPRIVKQTVSQSTLGFTESGAIPIRRYSEIRRSMELSSDIYHSMGSVEISPDFSDANIVPASIMGQDGYNPLVVDNPFLPHSTTVIPATSREELEESLIQYASNLILSVNTPGSPLPPSDPPPTGSGGPKRVTVEGNTPTKSVQRPPMLPPIGPKATEKERVKWHVMESLLISESSFLLSLTTAVLSYHKGLQEAIKSNAPILDAKSVDILFGPIQDILDNHKLFYLVLTQEAVKWNFSSKLGNIFTSAFNRRPVTETYTKYVENFPSAMVVLEKAIHRKPKFATFLIEKQQADPSRLSLQALLLKPIQRFPQYILFLQDFLKCTPDKHVDRVPLQMALSHFEAIAGHLDEVQKENDQESILDHMKMELKDLPYALALQRTGDWKGKLICQEEVAKIIFTKDGQVSQKKQYLLLFTNKLACAVQKPLDGSSKESTSEGSSKLISRWLVPFNSVEVIPPDYEWASGAPEIPEHEAIVRALRTEHQELSHDIESLSSVLVGLLGLKKQYQKLDVELFRSYLKVLQIMLAKNEATIRQYEGARLDLSFPSRDGLKKVKRTYAFGSVKKKERFLEAFRLAKLRDNPQNNPAWLISSDHYQESELRPITRKLPLFVQKRRLRILCGDLSAECAVHTGYNTVWIASGAPKSSEIAIVEATVDQPLVTDCFTVTEGRVLSMVYVPGSGKEGEEDPPTVWVGCFCEQHGKLLVYNSEGPTKSVKQKVILEDAVTSLVYFAEKVFASMANGQIKVFQKHQGGQWDLKHPKVIDMQPHPVVCGCIVHPFLWFGIQNKLCVVHPNTLQVQSVITLGTNLEWTIRKMVCIGAGVWVAQKGTCNLSLVHKTTHEVLQEIDVISNLKSIISTADINPKPSIDCIKVKISSLLASPGYLWVGLKNGMIMIYRIPRLEGVPTICSRPFLAMDAHNNSVRVMICVNTSAKMEQEKLHRYFEEETTDGLVVSNIEAKVKTLKARHSIAVCNFSVDQPVPKNSGVRRVSAGDEALDKQDPTGKGEGQTGNHVRPEVAEHPATSAGTAVTSQLLPISESTDGSERELRTKVFSEEQEEEIRRDIGKSIQTYHTLQQQNKKMTTDNWSGYDTLKASDVITVQDLYAPVNPANLTKHYKSKLHERSVHFVLIGGRGMKNFREKQKRSSQQGLPEADRQNDSFILVYEIPE